ncbi:MAG: hypothetical protein HY951_18170 [Bacteroidia bacterium]|nr:hypothetical protein [Bacteroidia bacterium]
MKKFLFILIVLTTILSGCRYKDGPMLSFRSVEKRLNGDWQVIGFTSDGIDSLQYYNDSCGGIMKITLYYPDGSLDSDNKVNFYNSKMPSMGGRFTFSNNKKIMHINFGDTSLYKDIGPLGGGRSEWKILKLTESKLKITTDFNSRNYIISFKKY